MKKYTPSAENMTQPALIIGKSMKKQKTLDSVEMRTIEPEITPR